MRSLSTISGRLVTAAALLALCAVSACASTGAAPSSSERRQLATDLLVQGATVAYIKQVPAAERGATAGRILAAVNAVLEVANDGNVTLQRLAQLAAERIPSTADPADRLLAMNVINVVQQALTDNTGLGGIESDTLLKLSGVLKNVSLVASLYVAPD